MTTLVAVGQMTSRARIPANWDICHQLAQDAKKRDAALLCLPENCLFMPEEESESLVVAQNESPMYLARFQTLARELGLWISLGGYPLVSPDPTRIYNTHIVIDQNGQIRAQYHKIHLFSVDIPGGPSLNEAKTVKPGDKLVTCESPVGVLGLSICYDLRFGELYTTLARAGAQVMLIPAAFTSVTGKAHWEILLRARAIETQSYVVAAAQTGVHNSKRRTHGHAMIVDPWGTIVAQCSEEQGLALAEIDLDYAAKVRNRIPVLGHDKLS